MVARVHNYGVVQVATLAQALLVQPKPAVDVLDHGRVVLTDSNMLLGRKFARVMVWLREPVDDAIRTSILPFHPGGDVHGRMRPVEIDDQQPRRALGSTVEEVHASARGEVVEIVLVVQGAGLRHTPPIQFARFGSLRDVLGAEPVQGRIQRREVCIVRLLRTHFAAEVAPSLACGDDHVREAPSLHVLPTVQRPPGGTLVQIDLSAGHGVIPALAKVLVERRDGGVVRVAVDLDAAVLVLHA